MTKLSERAKKLLRQRGIDISPYRPEWDWESNFMRQLETHQVNVVVDVGANSGQYAHDLRAAGFKGRIVSFEPLGDPFRVLESRCATDPLWECRRCALGDADGTISINIAGNSGESSSVLPMLDSHRAAFPPANYVGVDEVPVRKLDSVASEILRDDDVVFLKVDVQGFEKQVLAGASVTVEKQCVGMQLELSFIPLYEGGMLIREALDITSSMGFVPTGLQPCFTDMRNGRTLQVDGVFFREKVQ